MWGFAHTDAHTIVAGSLPGSYSFCFAFTFQFLLTFAWASLFSNLSEHSGPGCERDLTLNLEQRAQTETPARNIRRLKRHYWVWCACARALSVYSDGEFWLAGWVCVWCPFAETIAVTFCYRVFTASYLEKEGGFSIWINYKCLEMSSIDKA